MRTFGLAALSILALVAPVPAGAHEFWLAPTLYRAGRGDTLAVVAFVGTGFRGERKPYAATRTVRFRLDAARTLDLTQAASNGDLVFARFAPTDGGGALIGYESDFATIELPGADFDRYLALEGLDGPRAARARQRAVNTPGRERYARCPKTWIAGSDAAASSRDSRALTTQGLTLELVPLAVPGTGNTLALKLLFHGRPLPGALVRAWNRPLERGWTPTAADSRDSVAAVESARTDAHGIATLHVASPGEWLVSAVHMVPSRDRAKADWESYWASYTFARAGAR